MQILVIKTCDGPAYFSTARKAHIANAVALAIDQLENHRGEYCFSELVDEEVDMIVDKADSLSVNDLFARLMDIGVIVRVKVRES